MREHLRIPSFQNFSRHIRRAATVELKLKRWPVFVSSCPLSAFEPIIAHKSSFSLWIVSANYTITQINCTCVYSVTVNVTERLHPTSHCRVDNFFERSRCVTSVCSWFFNIDARAFLGNNV